MGKVTVVNKHHRLPVPEGTTRIYVGRGDGSVLGNPYSHLEGTLAKYHTASREDAVRFYEDWLRHEFLLNPQVHYSVVRLRQLAAEGDVELECWCAPLACHGDVLKRYIEPRECPGDCPNCEGDCHDQG